MRNKKIFAEVLIERAGWMAHRNDHSRALLDKADACARIESFDAAAKLAMDAIEVAVGLVSQQRRDALQAAFAASA